MLQCALQVGGFRGGRIPDAGSNKLKQERNAVLYLPGEWGRLVLSQLSALSQLLGEESKLKLVFVLAYVKLLPTVHRKEHWWSHKERVEGCKAELNRAYCSLEVTVLGRNHSAYFSKPIKWSRICCFLQCSMNTLSWEENCIITAEGKKGEKNLQKGQNVQFLNHLLPKEHKQSKPSHSQANPGDPCKAMWLGSDSYLCSQPCCLASSTLASSQISSSRICHHRFSICSRFTWRRVLALCDQSE